MKRTRETVNSRQESVQCFSEKYDSLFALVTSHEKEIKALRVDVGLLQAPVADQAVGLQQLKSDLNGMEQYGRRQNMEIHSLPYSPSERLEEFLQDLGGKLGIVRFLSSDVLAVHHLPGKRDSIPPVIVRFSSVHVKEPWMAARGKLRSIPMPPASSRLFFNDSLTQMNRELFLASQIAWQG